MNLSFDKSKKARIDCDVRIKTLETEFKRRVDGQNNAHTTLQSEHLAEVISLENEVQVLKDERTNASAAHKSVIDHMEADLAVKDRHIQSLELELANKAAALAAYDVKNAELHSCNIASSEQLSDLQEEHRLLGQSTEKIIVYRQQIDEMVKKWLQKPKQIKAELQNLKRSSGKQKSKSQSSYQRFLARRKRLWSLKASLRRHARATRGMLRSSIESKTRGMTLKSR